MKNGIKSIGSIKSIAPLIAVCCMLLTPLSSLACGGLFYSQTRLDQQAERLIFAVGQGSMTLYEQINYSGPANDFAWILPVPSVPRVDTTTTELFRALDIQTAPRYFRAQPPPCGWDPNRRFQTGVSAPQTGSVIVYKGGTVGPFAYDVLGSEDPNALTTWLQAHAYHVPDTMQALIRPYVASHMLFLAMRLQPQAGVQDITPVKLTFTTNGSDVMIPIRMAAAAAMPHMDMLVWIFSSSRYIPKNYQSLHISDNQLTDVPYPATNYTQLVDKAVSQSGGHGFVTEYAGPTRPGSSNEPTLATLEQNYSYVTRLYTRISPEQMTLDPVFTAQAGLPNVSNIHEISPPDTCDPLNSFLGRVSYDLGPAVYVYIAGIIILLALLIAGGFVLARRRRASKS